MLLFVAAKKRTAVFQMRLTDEERAELQLIVDETRESASNWVRQMIRKEAAKIKKANAPQK